MKKQALPAIINNQRGVSAVVIGICLFMLVGFIALAIDVGHLYVVRNELQNAADAGALAGARHLYDEDTFAINENANQIGAQAAKANIGDNKYVEVIFDPAASQDGDVQRGHWSFNARTFTRW
ncbi:MAG: Tad domain-containing protein, partial [Desulfobacteraceae bacterium]